MSIVTFIDRHASTTIDSSRTRQMWTSMQNDSSLDISQITPTLFPTEKRPFGVDFKVNAHGEHVIAAVWPGHAAAHAKIAAGSVLVRIDGQPLPRSLRQEELSDCLCRFEGTKMLITIRLPNDTDKDKTVERIVWFHPGCAGDDDKAPACLRRLFNVVVFGQERGMQFYSRQWEEWEERETISQSHSRFSVTSTSSTDYMCDRARRRCQERGRLTGCAEHELPTRRRGLHDGHDLPPTSVHWLSLSS